MVRLSPVELLANTGGGPLPVVSKNWIRVVLKGFQVDLGDSLIDSPIRRGWISTVRLYVH